MTYLLPFSRPVKVTQGFFGGYRSQTPGTHKRSGSKCYDSTYAVDFGLPEGTPLHAARTGYVVQWRDTGRFNYADFLRQNADLALRRRATKETNYVILCHDDGTFAIYAHLYFKGVDYKLKERWKKTGRMTKIEQGEPLGRSGNTGLSTGPHLHLVVCKGIAAESVPITFKDYQQTLDDRLLFPELHEGR